MRSRTRQTAITRAHFQDVSALYPNAYAHKIGVHHTGHGAAAPGAARGRGRRRRASTLPKPRFAIKQGRAFFGAG